MSRIGHTNEVLFLVLEQIILEIFSAYPHHALWSMASGAKSTTVKRSRKCLKVFAKARVSLFVFFRIKGTADRRYQATHSGTSTTTVNISKIIDEGTKMVEQLLSLCLHSVSKETSLSLYKEFPLLKRLTPTTLIIPLQTSLNVSLPSDASLSATHKPFPDNLPTFQSQFSVLPFSG